MFSRASPRTVFWVGAVIAVTGLLASSLGVSLTNQFLDYSGLTVIVPLLYTASQLTGEFAMPLGAALIAASLVLARLDRLFERERG